VVPGDLAAEYGGQPPEGLRKLSLTLLLSAALQVILKLILRIELRSAHRAFVGLARFVFFCHGFTSFRKYRMVALHIRKNLAFG
jgi:hypothetical protein